MTGLRVLHVGKFFPPFAGGIENFHCDLVHEQMRRGHTVASLIHHHQPGRPTVREESDGVLLWRARIWGRLLFTPLSPTFGRVLVKAVRECRPDVIHFHVPNPSTLWALISAETRRPSWVAQWQSDIVSSRIDRRLAPAYAVYAPLERQFLRRADAIVVASPPYLESSRPLARWRAKCHVVPLGISLDRLPAPREEPWRWAETLWRPGDLRVLAIGRLTYYKGHEVLLRAVNHSPQTQLCLVGSGDQLAPLRSLVVELGLQDRVQLLGSLDNDRVQALLATCDCLCLPSLERTEAFGLVLAEAMRYGKPQVASDIPGSGVGWVVQDGRTGLLVAPNDPERLAVALQQLHRDPALRRTMGLASAEAFQRFDIACVAEQIDRVYAHILNRRAS